MPKILARGLAIASAIALGLILSGCDQFVAPPLSYTVVGATPVVRTCLPMTVTRMIVTAFSGEPGDKGEVIWEAQGRVPLEAGTELEIGAPIQGFLVIKDRRPLRLDEDFTFDMDVLNGGGDTRHTDSYFEPDVLTEGVWLDGYGQALDVPCTHAPCQPGWTCLNDWDEPDGRELDPLPTFVPTLAPIVE